MLICLFSFISCIFHKNIFLNLLVGYISETMKLGSLGLPLYRAFVLEELKEATDNFNPSFLIGEGSYGQVISG